MSTSVYSLNLYFVTKAVFSPFCSGRASSIGVILLGSLYYTWEKDQESRRASAGPAGGYERVKMEEVEAGNQKESKPE